MCRGGGEGGGGGVLGDIELYSPMHIFPHLFRPHIYLKPTSQVFPVLEVIEIRHYTVS